MLLLLGSEGYETNLLTYHFVFCNGIRTLFIKKLNKINHFLTFVINALCNTISTLIAVVFVTSAVLSNCQVFVVTNGRII